MTENFERPGWVQKMESVLETVNEGVLSDGRKYAFKGFNRPSSILVSEVFLIENGKIRRVEMVGPSVTYHLNSVWPGGLSGN